MAPTLVPPSWRVTAGVVSILIGLTACGPVHPTVQPTAADIGQIKRLAVVVTGDDELKIVLEQTKGRGAGAAAMSGAAGGILGALIVGSIVAGRDEARDDKTAKGLASSLNGFTPHPVFLESFTKTLRDSGRLMDIQVLDKAPDARQAALYDGVVEFRIEQWGLRVATPDESDRLAGFLNLNARLTRSPGDSVIWREVDTVLGQGRHALAAYREDATLLRTEMTAVAEDAGYRTAIRILYPKEAPK